VYVDRQSLLHHRGQTADIGRTAQAPTLLFQADEVIR
jgi:hypothetical protein